MGATLIVAVALGTVWWLVHRAVDWEIGGYLQGLALAAAACLLYWQASSPIEWAVGVMLSALAALGVVQAAFYVESFFGRP